MITARQSAAQGFSLVETIGVVVLIALLAVVAGMAVVGLYKAGEDKQAIAAAQAVNQAEQIYSIRVSAANTNWGNASNNDQKFALISAYLPGNPPSLEAFEPNNYTLGFGQLGQTVSVTDPNGNLVQY